MPQNPFVRPEPFFFPGGSAGALLVHGFSGSPAELRDMGQHLASRGLAARGILLRGHGTSPRALARCRWEDWRADVEDGVAALRRDCRTVFLAGLSMGGALALLRAAGADDIAGVVAMAPALRLSTPFPGLARWLRRAVPYVPSGSRRLPWRHEPPWKDRVWSYDWLPLAAVHQLTLLMRAAAAALPEVQVPVLIMHGLRDPTVPVSASELVYSRIASADKRLFWLPRSGHILPAGEERGVVWDAAADWIVARATGA